MKLFGEFFDYILFGKLRQYKAYNKRNKHRRDFQKIGVFVKKVKGYILDNRKEKAIVNYCEEAF